jgi:vacuolar-type H+-ATPase subunit C/Vma6
VEAALDRGYLNELVSRAAALSGEDRELVEPVIQQEADNLHLALIGRGKFVYGLEPERLLEFHVAGTKIPRQRFAAMLAEPDLAAVARLAEGRALDVPPSGLTGTGESIPDAAGLERCGWHRFARLANRAFRRSHVGLGAIVGYVALRRVEVANLITLSEAIRQGVEPDAIRGRFLSQAQLPSAYA